MRRPVFNKTWPQSWQSSYKYDLEEFFGPVQLYGYHYSYQCRFSQTLELLNCAVPAPASVLDIAAAQGNFSLRLAELGYAVTWNDLREELEPYVRLKYEAGQLAYRPGNVFNLTFDQPFEVVLITEVIEHVAHPDEFLNKVAGLIKPGGYIVMTTPNGGYFRNRLPKFTATADPSIYEGAQFKPDADGHIFLLHQDEIPVLAKAAGLEILEFRLLVNPLLRGALGFHRFLRWLPAPLVWGIERLVHVLPNALQRRLFMQMAVVFKKSLPAGS